MTGTAESRNPAAGMDGRESRGRGLGGLGRARLPAPPTPALAAPADGRRCHLERSLRGKSQAHSLACHRPSWESAVHILGEKPKGVRAPAAYSPASPRAS